VIRYDPGSNSNRVLSAFDGTIFVTVCTSELVNPPASLRLSSNGDSVGEFEVGISVDGLSVTLGAAEGRLLG